MRVRFQFLTYIGILCLLVVVDDVTSLQPTSSHESKNYESKEKLWRSSPSAITRTWTCTHELNPLASLLQSQSSFHFSSVFGPSSSRSSASFSSFPKSIFLFLPYEKSRYLCVYWSVLGLVHILASCFLSLLLVVCLYPRYIYILAALERPAGGPRKFADLRIRRNINWK